MMDERIKTLRTFFVEEKKQKKVRQPTDDPYLLAYEFKARNMSALDRATERLIYVLQKEKPVLFPSEMIVFTRTVQTIPELYTREELKELEENHHIHERGDVCNINVDYTKLLVCGFETKIRELKENIRKFEQSGKKEEAHFEVSQIKILNAVIDLADRYRELAEREGNTLVAETLAVVPRYKPTTFLQALQMFRIIHYTMWCGRNYHNTIGRFDQYMYPYYERDMKRGSYTHNSVLALLEEFFLSFNRDSDLYPGMQQGDNGQSMVLGGLDTHDVEQFNDLSRLCLEASCELHVIDPKINLRVNKKTPLASYLLGTRLTKQGLGFPQYSGDDVIIPGLIKLGYTQKDAHDYAVAACWEFIIPGKAMDIPNIGALSFAKAVEDATKEDLRSSNTYEEFQVKVDEKIEKQCEDLIASTRNVFMFPAPFLSLMMEGCEEKGRDVSLGCRYNNYGFHGTGLATAADSLVNIKEKVFEKRSLSKNTLLEAIDDDFQKENRLCNILRYDSPKMGNDEDDVDEIAIHLMHQFVLSLKGRKNDRGGIFRPGTGSAMYYIWHSKNLDATPDGRHAGEGIPANYSPSLFCRSKGPVSIIKSFTKPDLTDFVNGGPLTLELHDTMFRTKESIGKVAVFVKSFFDMGGHQLQLNAVNRDALLDAQKHPEKYRNLIVRVWGWSGYFVELDKCYQDHIIQRMELQA